MHNAHDRGCFSWIRLRSTVIAQGIRGDAFGIRNRLSYTLAGARAPAEGRYGGPRLFPKKIEGSGTRKPPPVFFKKSDWDPGVNKFFECWCALLWASWCPCDQSRHH